MAPPEPSRKPEEQDSRPLRPPNGVSLSNSLQVITPPPCEPRPIRRSTGPLYTDNARLFHEPKDTKPNPFAESRLDGRFDVVVSAFTEAGSNRLISRGYVFVHRGNDRELACSGGKGENTAEALEDLYRESKKEVQKFIRRNWKD